jgi:DNA polymerase-3 subunit epsilon
VSALVFVDVETTGLDPLVHDVVEIAWAVEGGEIKSYVPQHTLSGADPKALEINGYFDRDLYSQGRRDARIDYQSTLLFDLNGATIVGSNPAFDTAFLRKKLGFAPWHHRLIDVSNVAMMVFDRLRPPGLAAIAGSLRGLGHDIPEPDHTATGDVECTRVVYTALRQIAGES